MYFFRSEVLELAREGYNPYSIACMLSMPIDDVFKILNEEFSDEDYEELA